MSKVMKRAPGVDMVLLRRHFVVVKPAQWVVVAGCWNFNRAICRYSGMEMSQVFAA